MTNPYEAPRSIVPQPGRGPEANRYSAAGQVSGPAIGLMVVAILCVLLLIIGFLIDSYLLTNGLGERWETMVRIAWSVVLFAASCFVFWGSLQMKQLRSYQIARWAAIVACVPCVGPCCLLGIPFGVWALTVLSRTEVARAFESSG